MNPEQATGAAPAPQSSADLQVLLGLLERHGIAPTPANYALWFEYAKGEDPSLSAEMDRLISSGTRFTEPLLQELAERHLDRRYQGPAMPEVGARVTQILTDLLNDLAVLQTETGCYDDHLQQHLTRIEQIEDQTDLEKLLDVLAEETKHVRRATQQMRSDLARRSDEIAAMQVELQQVKRSANSDPLTGLPNRRALLEAIGHITEDSENRHSLLMLDIDNFKAINDQHGHLVGDRVIRFVADVIRQNTKGQDTPARFGGEEFAVLLPATPLAGALALAEKVRHIIASARLVRSMNQQAIGQITVSGGVASYRRGEDTLALMERADQALYLAKERGRNKVVPETEL